MNVLHIPTKFGNVRVDFAAQRFYLDGERTPFADLGGHVVRIVLADPICRCYAVHLWD